MQKTKSRPSRKASPTFPEYKRPFPWVIGFFLGVLCMCLVSTARAQNAELRFLQHLSEHRSVGMTRWMQGISNTTTETSLAVPFGFYLVYLAGKQEGMKEKSYYLLETIAVGSGAAIVLKYVINRPRPSTQDSLIIPASDMGSPSFPSGHASIAFATAASLSLACPKWYVIVPAYLWAGAVGFSRLYLGVHYPSDVLAGAVLGTGSALLCRQINKWLFKPQPDGKKLFWY